MPYFCRLPASSATAVSLPSWAMCSGNARLHSAGSPGHSYCCLALCALLCQRFQMVDICFRIHAGGDVMEERRTASVCTSCVGQCRSKSHSRAPVAGFAPVHRQQRVQVLPQVVRAAERDRHHRRHDAGDAGGRRKAALLGSGCLVGWFCHLHSNCNHSTAVLSLAELPEKDTTNESQLGL